MEMIRLAPDIMEGIWIDGLFKAGNLDQNKDFGMYSQTAQFIEGRQAQLHIEKRDLYLIIGSCFFFERNRKSHAVYIQQIPFREKDINLWNLVAQFFIDAEQSIKHFFKSDIHGSETEKFGIGEKHEQCGEIIEILNQASQKSTAHLEKVLGYDEILKNVVFGKFLLDERVTIASENNQKSILFLIYFAEKIFHETIFNFKFVSSERDLYETDRVDISLRQAPSRYDVNLDAPESKCDEFTILFYKNVVSLYNSLRTNGKLTSMSRQNLASVLIEQVSSQTKYKDYPLETLVNSVAGRRIALERIIIQTDLQGNDNGFLKVYEKMNESEKKLLFSDFLQKNYFQKNVFHDSIKSVFLQKDNDLANLLTGKKFPEYQKYKKELKTALVNLDWKDTRILARAKDLLVKIVSSSRTDISEGGRLLGFYLFLFLKQERALDKNFMKEYGDRLQSIDIHDYQEKSFPEQFLFTAIAAAVTGWIAFVIGILLTNLGYVNLLQSIIGIDQGLLFIVLIVSVVAIVSLIIAWFFVLRVRLKK